MTALATRTGLDVTLTSRLTRKEMIWHAGTDYACDARSSAINAAAIRLGVTADTVMRWHEVTVTPCQHP